MRLTSRRWLQERLILPGDYLSQHFQPWLRECVCVGVLARALYAKQAYLIWNRERQIVDIRWYDHVDSCAIFIVNFG